MNDRSFAWFNEAESQIEWMKEGKYCYTSVLCDRVKATEGVGIVGKTNLEVQKDPELGLQYYEENQKLLRKCGQ